MASDDDNPGERRLRDLEETLAHSQGAVQDLSDELAKQWRMVEGLIGKVAELEEKIETLSMAMPSPPGDEPPPHY